MRKKLIGSAWQPQLATKRLGSCVYITGSGLPMVGHLWVKPRVPVKAHCRNASATHSVGDDGKSRSGSVDNLLVTERDDARGFVKVVDDVARYPVSFKGNRIRILRRQCPGARLQRANPCERINPVVGMRPGLTFLRLIVCQRVVVGNRCCRIGHRPEGPPNIRPLTLRQARRPDIRGLTQAERHIVGHVIRVKADEQNQRIRWQPLEAKNVRESTAEKRRERTAVSPVPVSAMRVTGPKEWVSRGPGFVGFRLAVGADRDRQM